MAVNKEDIKEVEAQLDERKQAVEAAQTRIRQVETHISTQYAFLQSQNTLRQVSVELEPLLRQLKELQDSNRQSEQKWATFEQQTSSHDRLLIALEAEAHMLLSQIAIAQQEQRAVKEKAQQALSDISNDTSMQNHGEKEQAAYYDSKIRSVIDQVAQTRRAGEALQTEIAHRQQQQINGGGGGGRSSSKYQALVSSFASVV